MRLCFERRFMDSWWYCQQFFALFLWIFALLLAFLKQSIDFNILFSYVVRVICDALLILSTHWLDSAISFKVNSWEINLWYIFGKSFCYALVYSCGLIILWCSSMVTKPEYRLKPWVEVLCNLNLIMYEFYYVDIKVKKSQCFGFGLHFEIEMLVLLKKMPLLFYVYFNDVIKVYNLMRLIWEVIRRFECCKRALYWI